MPWHSQIGQDQAVVEYYQGKRDGYFVELGAWDGVKLSNTLALEEDYDWNGLCIEPLPDLYRQLVVNRKCHCADSACYSESGKELKFTVANSCTMLSGITAMIDKNRVGTASEITVITETLTDVLDAVGAPANIDFLSLDTEGSELEVLKGLDFKKYTFGYISVEHNYKSGPRQAIRDYLISQGYRYYRDNQWDDDYVFVGYTDVADLDVV